MKRIMRIFQYNFVELGWVGLMSGLNNASGLLPTVWDSSRRMIGRHALATLIHNGGDDSPALVPPEV